LSSLSLSLSSHSSSAGVADEIRSVAEADDGLAPRRPAEELACGRRGTQAEFACGRRLPRAARLARGRSSSHGTRARWSSSPRPRSEELAPWPMVPARRVSPEAEGVQRRAK
jgi:hypothetical protein